MKEPNKDPRVIVDRFLEGLGEPLKATEWAAHSADSILEGVRRKGLDRKLVNAESAQTVPPTLGRRPMWLMAAASAVVVVLVGIGLLMAILAPAGLKAAVRVTAGEVFEDGNVRPRLAGEPIALGQVVRVLQGDGAVLSLADGSRIELGHSAELSVDRMAGGVQIDLRRGNVIVTAAKQRNGHLYVRTRDCVVSVTGTVFSVASESSGSRVAVIAGEVQVERGGISQTLGPGQQVTTNPAMENLPVKSEIRWSRDAVSHLALLEQSAAPAAPRTQEVPSVVEGTIRQLGTTIGIADVGVRLCSKDAFEAFKEGSKTATTALLEDALRQAEANRLAGLPPKEQIAEIRLTNNPFAPNYNGAPTVSIRDRDGNTIFALGGTQQALCKDPQTTTSDSSGRFALSNVTVGEYVILAEREGYFAPFDPIGLASSVATGTVNLVDGGSIPSIALYLIPGAVVTGHVRNAEGRPVAQAQMQAFMNVSRDGKTTSLSVAAGITNDLGEYRLFWLPPGEYYIAARIRGQRSKQLFYPNASKMSDGVTVPVREGEVIAAIDIVGAF